MENTKTSILEEVRSWKEEVARENDFNIEKIINSAMKRQSHSKHRIIKLEEQEGGIKENRSLVSG